MKVYHTELGFILHLLPTSQKNIYFVFFEFFPRFLTGVSHPAIAPER